MTFVKRTLKHGEAFRLVARLKQVVAELVEFDRAFRTAEVNELEYVEMCTYEDAGEFEIGSLACRTVLMNGNVITFLLEAGSFIPCFPLR